MDGAPVNRFVTVIDETAPRPNVVIILADDLGYGDLGVQGRRAIHTVQIVEGVRISTPRAADRPPASFHRLRE